MIREILAIATLLLIVGAGIVLMSGDVLGRGHAEPPFQRHTTYSCTATAGEALAANPGRISALFINNGAEAAWLFIDGTAAANTGIRINQNGGSYFISAKEGNLDRESVDCDTASGTALILIIEWSGD